MIHLLYLLFVPLITCDRIVQTNNGPIRGLSVDAKNVDAFLGIPYAEPPLGNLRFAKPVPKLPWKETLDVKEYSAACIQPLFELMSKFFNDSITMDEDCLYLNLWVPKSKGPLKTIMIFIHGGGFMTGTANSKIYNGANLAQHGDVIVASMNYRVGTLGYFSAFIDEAPGSIGMYDQILAIQWIKDNAKHFGGDPDNIVLFGESAGSFSISLHLISPLSKNLFNRAILQSGATISPMFSNANEIVRAGSQTISKALGCAEYDDELKDNPKKVVECMKNLPAEKFPTADEVLFKHLAFLVPRTGDEFLPNTPTDMFRNGESKDTEVLLGVTRDEGTMFISFQSGFESGQYFGESISADSFNETTAKSMLQSLAKNEEYERVIQKYLERVKEESRYTYLDAVSDIVGDSFITCSTVFLADFQSLKQHPTYFYVFDYRSPSSQFAEWMGVPHFEEVPYVFGNPFQRVFSENEEELSRDIMDMWVAFAKTGNPNIPGGIKWPEYTYENPKYLLIGMRDRVGVNPDNHRCEGWRSLYQATIDDEVKQNFKKSKN